ncbi:MAG: carboxypeptidase-like regulatory domain-containing protein [Muribaculaceae bacterium]|nr:carboxypeptidase-like regulatory domain-containing protein [Muribaculaceae bacterium]
MKTIYKILSLAVLFVLLLAACTEEPTVTTGNIFGTVTTSSGGTEPLSGVTVSIPSSGQSTTTGSNGSFTFSNIHAGNYTLKFSKTGYEAKSKNVNLIAGQTYQCDVQMAKISQEADIAINPSSLNFGTTQTDLSVTIRNNGNTTADWSLDLGNNHWLSVSQTGGSIQANKTQSITFTVNRDYLSENKTIVVNLQTFGNSYPIHVSCSPRIITSEMSIDPKELDFGSNLIEKTFTIRNTGKDALNWNVSNLQSSVISLSADKGVVAGGGSSVVTVNLDREKLTGTLNTSFVISDGIKDQVLTVKAEVAVSGGDEPNDPNNPDKPDNPDTPTNPSGIVVRNGLFAYFPFNGNYDDLSGNDHYGYGSPDPIFADGLTTGTQSISFSKMKENAFVVNNGLIDSRSMTVSLWIKNISEGNIFHVTSSNNNNGEEMMSLSYNSGHLKYIVTRYNNHYAYDKSGNFTHKSVDDGEWHHIVLVSDYSRTKNGYATTLLYIDGRLMDTITEEISSYNETQPTSKHYGTGTKFVLGGPGVPTIQVANMRVYDARLLSSDEIKTIYNAKQ